MFSGLFAHAVICPYDWDWVSCLQQNTISPGVNNVILLDQCDRALGKSYL